MAKKISYATRDFAGLRQELVNLTNDYYPDLVKNTNDASIFSVLLDLNAAVADNLHFHIDRVFQETILDFAQQRQSLFHIAKTYGIKIPGNRPSVALCDFSINVPVKGDKEDGHGAEGLMTREQLLTDVEQAADFVKQTQCDALAIAIGTSHGAYKFSKKPTGDTLAIGRIREIHARIPNTHLVMHGSSSVPQELLAQIREFGGDMKETYGVPVEEIQEGIKNGVRKINIDTDIRLAMTAAIRRYLFENPGKFDPRDYLKPAREAAKEICKARFIAFGCAGQATKIQPISLDKMVQKYLSGELAQIVRA